MYENGSKKGTVRFAIAPGGQSSKTHLAGDFSNWQPVAMRKQKTGNFVAIVPVDVGTHEYKFLVDNQWVLDPDNNAWAPNAYGTMNSVAQVD